jgi:hypothetical protein
VSRTHLQYNFSWDPEETEANYQEALFNWELDVIIKRMDYSSQLEDNQQGGVSTLKMMKTSGADAEELCSLREKHALDFITFSESYGRLFICCSQFARRLIMRCREFRKTLEPCG